MQAEPIVSDTTSRGVINTHFYPISLVQIFRPCSWNDLSTYMCEGDRFRAVVAERQQWINENHIKGRVHFQVVSDPNEIEPNFYRLFVEFTCMRDAELYRNRWMEWAAS